MPDPATSTGTAARDHHVAMLVESVVDYAIFVLDPEGHVMSWNRGAERIKGYRPEEIIGEHFRRFYSEEDRARRKPEWELEVAAREGRYEEEAWRYRRDGSQFWANVVITAIRDDRGTLFGFGKITRDLTTRRLSEEMLRSNAAELRLANQQLSQFGRFIAAVRDYAIFMLDPGGHITTWNAGAANIKGYTEDEILGKHFSIFYTEPDLARNHPAAELAIAAREGRYEEEGWRLRKDGSRFWASVTITAVRDERGILIAFAKVTRDLSARRAAEDRLRATQAELERANGELKRFAAVAAHDLRDPLATAAGFADLVLREDGDRLSDTGREYLRHVTAAMSRMQALVEDLLEYATLGADVGQLTPVDLAVSLPPVLLGLHAAIEQRAATIETDIPDGAEVLADPSGAHTLLQNLVSNALKYGSGEGPVVRVAASREDRHWRLTVDDNGTGITPADQDRIFAAFQRLPGAGAVPGTGLGLAICKRVVDRAGGEIGVEPAPGGGSRFWVRLPAAS